MAEAPVHEAQRAEAVSDDTGSSYYLETDDREVDLFFELDEHARLEAERLTAYRSTLFGAPSATISLVTVQGPAAITTLGDMIRLLNRSSYATHTLVIAKYRNGKEVPK